MRAYTIILNGCRAPVPVQIFTVVSELLDTYLSLSSYYTTRTLHTPMLYVHVPGTVFRCRSNLNHNFA
jgi:hypothetical protein